MPKIRNVSPRGALDVPLLRCVVGRGDEVDVTDEQAARLLEQPDVWQSADAAPPVDLTKNEGA